MPTFPFTPSPLPTHARQGHVKKLEQALKDGADPNGTDLSGVTALHVVMGLRPGQGVRMIRMLVAAGADVNALDEQGVPPLHHFLKSGKPLDHIEALLDAGASMEVFMERSTGSLVPRGQSALDLALQKLNEEAFDLLIARGAPVNQRLGTDWTVLHRAAALTVSNHYTQALLAAGADPFAEDGFGRTPGSVARGSNVEVLAVWIGEQERAALRTTLNEVVEDSVAPVVERVRSRL